MASGGSGLDSLGGGALGRDTRRLEQDRGVFATEYFRGKTHGRIGLTLAKRALARARLAQAVKQRRQAGVKIVLKLRMHAQGRFVDGQLGSVGAGGVDKINQRLDLGDFVWIEASALALHTRTEQ